MKTTEYKVKKGDTFASLGNPQLLMKLNKGVPKLSPGRVIKIPGSKFDLKNNPVNNTLPLNDPFPVNTNPLFNVNNNFITPQIATPGSFQSGGVVNAPAVNNTQGFLNANYLNRRDLSNVTATGIATAATVTAGEEPPRPLGVFDPNDAEGAKAWRNYWNKGLFDKPVYQMSREDVWNIKAAQRRKADRGGKRRSVISNIVQAEVPEPQGNAVNAMLSWRVG